jgi:hypothetical protein
VALVALAGLVVEWIDRFVSAYRGARRKHRPVRPFLAGAQGVVRISIEHGDLGDSDQRRLLFDLLGLKFSSLLNWRHVLHVSSSKVISTGRPNHQVDYHEAETEITRLACRKKAASKGGL